MTDTYVQTTVTEPRQGDAYKGQLPSYVESKPHTCNCAPDAPCRVSGKCTCMARLLKSLDGVVKQ